MNGLHVVLGGFLLQFVKFSDAVPAGACPGKDDYDNPVVYLVDSVECNIFYKCQSGVAYKYDCPKGMEFSSDISGCVDPPKSDCGRRNAGESSEPDEENDDDENTVYDDEDEDDDDEDDEDDVLDNRDGGDSNDLYAEDREEEDEYEEDVVGECPKVDGPIATILPHATNCANFFLCVEGKPVLKECPETLLFNSKLLVCDYQKAAFCYGDKEEDHKEPEEEEEEEETGEPWVGNCLEEDGPYVQLLPHASDCAKFFICNNGKPVGTQCPSGLVFNSQLMVCDYAASAACE